MSAKINNHTVLSHEILFANDEKFRPVVTPILKATFDILTDGQLKFSEEQIPINLAGEYNGDPECSSYIYEPECAFIKPATDVIVIGNAISSQGPLRHLAVEIQIGNLNKRIGVIGDRQWLKQINGYVISEITPFESMPLTYENAFGGWDRRGADPEKHDFEGRNTVGKGFYVKKTEPNGEPMYLPNIEDPRDLIKSIDDRPAPMGCGFTLPHWLPRAQTAGTYDKNWEENKSPMLPEDFQRKFFNAASEGLVAQGYLTGKEKVQISNMTPGGMLVFYLPGVKPPVCQIELKETETELTTFLDTVIINTNTMQLQLLWRNVYLLDRGPHDVESIDIYTG
jgi:hypothetical protein